MKNEDNDSAMLLWYLNFILLTPVIILGVLCNFLSILTWSRGRHKYTSTAALLTALAIADTIVLTIPALERWLLRVLYFLIRSENIVTCKIWAFLSYFGPTISSWIVVFVTAERFVSIWFPVRVSSICTRIKVIFVVLGMCLLIATLYIPLMVNVTLTKQSHVNVGIQSEANSTNMTSYTTICDATKDQTFRRVYFPAMMWLDMVFLFTVPFVLIVVGNILIMFRIFKSRTIWIQDGQNVSRRSRTVNSFTIRVFAISIVFLMCLSPVTFYQVIRIHTGYEISDYVEDIIHILLYANSGFNFILYCAIGSGFRKDLKMILSNLFSRTKVRPDNMGPSMLDTQVSRL